MVLYSDVIGSAHIVEFLPVLVEGTEKYMCIASKSDLENLISHVDGVIRLLEEQGRPEQREGIAVAAMKVLRSKVLERINSY
jgi:hypothetical protein